MHKNESTSMMMNAGVDIFMIDRKESMLKDINYFQMEISNNTIEKKTLNNVVI